MPDDFDIKDLKGHLHQYLTHTHIDSDIANENSFANYQSSPLVKVSKVQHLVGKLTCAVASIRVLSSM